MQYFTKYKKQPEKGYVPANSCAGHGRDNTRPHATQETRPAKLALDNGRRIEETPNGANFLTLGKTAGLEEGLHNVQGSGDTGGKGTSETTGHAVGERIIFALGVHDLGDRLVCDELGGRKRYGHAEGGRVGEIEGLETLGAVNGFGALHQTRVDGSVDLHSLFDDY